MWGRQPPPSPSPLANAMGCVWAWRWPWAACGGPCGRWGAKAWGMRLGVALADGAAVEGKAWSGWARACRAVGQAARRRGFLGLGGGGARAVALPPLGKGCKLLVLVRSAAGVVRRGALA